MGEYPRIVGPSKFSHIWYPLNRSMVVCSGMLMGAVLPPSDDHTYAQWMTREGSPTSPQPSPFKRLHATPLKLSDSRQKGQCLCLHVAAM